jgi:hypothetical protein
LDHTNTDPKCVTQTYSANMRKLSEDLCKNYRIEIELLKKDLDKQIKKSNDLSLQILIMEQYYELANAISP